MRRDYASHSSKVNLHLCTVFHLTLQHARSVLSTKSRDTVTKHSREDGCQVTVFVVGNHDEVSARGDQSLPNESRSASPDDEISSDVTVNMVIGFVQ